MTKIKELETSMQVKKRDDGTEFTCFTDTAPEELQDLFLENYEVKDTDYEIFSDAIDTIVDVQHDLETEDLEELEKHIQENYTEFASVYNADRLDYLDIWNDSEIAEIVQNYNCDRISLACAIWYDDQVQGAISLIINNYMK